MRSMHSLKSGAAVCAAALALVAGACNTGERDTMNQEPGAQPPAASGGAGDRATEEAAVTLTGCLQQGDGNDYILTQVNGQPGAIATTGESPSGEVQQQQQQAAARSYRLSGGPDNLRDMVGHQVRVSGTIADRGNVQEQAQEQREEAREGEEPRGADIDAGDLAEIDVTAAESIAQTCGATN